MQNLGTYYQISADKPYRKLEQNRKILFIDRDGTLLKEPHDEQVDSFEKLDFYPGVITYLAKIANELDYELVLISNQDGLGTTSHPEENFWPVHNFMLKTLANEGIIFNEQLIDRTFPKELAITRKPGIGMLKSLIEDKSIDISNSFVIGDRLNDVILAKNLKCKAIWLNNQTNLGNTEFEQQDLSDVVSLETTEWQKIYEYLKLGARAFTHQRNTNETQISIEINLDGTGKSKINTGLHFFDHMLDQLARHGSMDLRIEVEGDLEIDEHHTIEDTGIALGETFLNALGNKKGIERYGFCLPMDDCQAQVSIDFGGRSWIVWDAEFKREMVGDMPTEMFFHFFKSFSDAAKANLNIKAEGQNEHHKIEAIFKAFAKCIKMAVKRDIDKMILPSTKGVL